MVLNWHCVANCYRRSNLLPVVFLAVESIAGPSLGVFKVNNWSKFVKKKVFVKKHYKIGVSAHFLKSKKRAQIFKVSNWSKLFFFGPQLGPVIDFNLAQLLTLKNGHFFHFCFFFFFFFFKVLKYLFYSAFWTSTKICQKNGPKKTITFHILQNTGS